MSHDKATFEMEDIEMLDAADPMDTDLPEKLVAHCDTQIENCIEADLLSFILGSYLLFEVVEA